MEREMKLGMCSSKKRKNKDNDDVDVVLSSSYTPCRLKHKSKKKNNNHDDDLLDYSLEKCSTAKKNVVVESSIKENHELKNGDIVNLSELLFTKDRDFLITYNDRNRPVQPNHLEGKVVVLHFVPLAPLNHKLRLGIDSLLHIYNAIYPKGGFEVVLVGFTPDYDASWNPQQLNLDESFLEECFEEMLSGMPWTAIPFSDAESRNYLEKKLRLPVSCFVGERQTFSVVIDPTGVVLQTCADIYFLWCGAQAYPFSDERIDRIGYEDEETLNHPSITKLLTFSECNYVINNENQEVPVQNLEDKVVALFFYEENLSTNLTLIEIQTACEELLAKEKNFEIVLVYDHNSNDTSEYATEESFRNTFSNMPWLALPFKDPRCTYLKRIFSYPMELEGQGPDPRLVIIGPQGKYYERFGADILQKFGIKSYPFTRMRIAKLEAKYIKKLKLDTLWDPNTSFKQKNGLEVKLSQLVGKRIIFIIDGNWDSAKFLRRLKERYLEMKETDDAFEVIYIPKKQGSSYGKHVLATLPWLRHPPLPRGSHIAKKLCCLFRKAVGLVAFDRDGTAVRRSTYPIIEKGNKDFPFNAGGLEKEALMEVTENYNWDYVPIQEWEV
ncbi:putative nucleoredoxin 1-1 [Apium graveolens]|uniref:putative nucleoredoxin 1-1 n=1 Tax=Apium graveolens TaxID=4045 RepID=UPI003D7BA901